MGNSSLQEALNFVNPISFADFEDGSYIHDPFSIGATVLQNLDTKGLDVSNAIDLALVAVPNQDSLGREYCSAQKIREQIYLLKQVSANIHFADFGNLKKGATFNETMFALKEFCSLLFQQGVRVVVIGGDKCLTLSLYKAMCDFKEKINISIVDSHIPLSGNTNDIYPNNYVDQISESNKNKIYNISFLGSQSYFVDHQQLARISELNYENYRLGFIRDFIEEVEPIFRDSDVVSMDLGAVRLIDAPGQKKGSPNGLYTEESCQLSKYAGISDRAMAFALFGYDVEMDNTMNITAMLAAQIIWYFIDGFCNRRIENPQEESPIFNKYLIPIDEIGFPIVFYKSNETDRWWLEINDPIKKKEKEEPGIIVSCSEMDYKKASRNEIPNRWWANFKKIE